MFGGVQIFETLNAVSWHEDWSRVRSPSRAARRLKSGKRKHAIPKFCKPGAYQVGAVLYVHPEVAQAMKVRALAAKHHGLTRP